MKKISLYILIVFYVLAGINHFRSPANYIAIIPPYLGHASLLNLVAGIAEILLAILLLFTPTRRLAVYGIIFMLLAFIPVHVYMLQYHICIGEKCAPDWLLWVRLFIMQPLLIAWAWSVRDFKNK